MGVCSGEEVRQGSERENIGIEVDQGGEEGVKSEEVEFGQGKIEIRSAWLSVLLIAETTLMGQSSR